MNNLKIASISALEILDSRGFPTIKATVRLENGIVADAAVPSGASTGKHEAVELRDGDKNRYFGKGVLQAVANVNDIIAVNLIGELATEQEKIDKALIALDGTDNKSRLGANATLSVSLAVAKAAAKGLNMPLYKYLGGEQANTLPVPLCNVINGGMHASNNIDIQEFMIAPTGAMRFSEGLRWCAETFQQLKTILLNNGMSTSVGDEGGFAPMLPDTDAALSLLEQAIHQAGHDGNIKFALDAASSEWLVDSGDYLMPKTKKHFANADFINYWAELVNKFPIISIEDCANEDDWQTWIAINKKIGATIQLVGDDLFVTNTLRLKKGIELQAANSILIKPNQIGTLTETAQAIKTAKKAGFTTVMSHRSGETEDTTIADLAVGLSTDQIKTGSLSRSERVAKYNRLLEIENELGDKAIYKGIKAF